MFQVEANVGHRLLAPRIAYLVGTKGSDAIPDLAPISNLTSVSRTPQVLVVAVFKRWQTYTNLRAASGFTVSVPNVAQLEAVWKLGEKYSGFQPPLAENKMEACGAEIDYVGSKFGPVLATGIGWLECRILSEATIESDHGIFFGEIVRASFNEEYLTAEGFYLKNSKPIMQVVKNSFATTSDHCTIPYYE